MRALHTVLPYICDFRRFTHLQYVAAILSRHDDGERDAVDRVERALEDVAELGDDRLAARFRQALRIIGVTVGLLYLMD